MSENAGSGEEAEAPDPLRRVLDLIVFAPMGVVLTVAEDLPGLISKGRQRVESEISNARVVGQFFVAQGRSEASQRLGNLLNRPAAEPAPTAAAPGPATRTAAAPAPSPKPAPDPGAQAIVNGALADYATLSASQVVRRLESLGPDELRAVQRHESSHRNRRTILNRASQLLDESPASSASE